MGTRHIQDCPEKRVDGLSHPTSEEGQILTPHQKEGQSEAISIQI